MLPTTVCICLVSDAFPETVSALLCVCCLSHRVSSHIWTPGNATNQSMPISYSLRSSLTKISSVLFRVQSLWVSYYFLPQFLQFNFVITQPGSPRELRDTPNVQEGPWDNHWTAVHSPRAFTSRPSPILLPHQKVFSARLGFSFGQARHRRRWYVVMWFYWDLCIFNLFGSRSTICFQAQLLFQAVEPSAHPQVERLSSRCNDQ